MPQNIRIADRTYSRNPEVDRFQIPMGELGPLRMVDIPEHSHLEVLGLPLPPEDVEFEMWIVNNGEELSIYGGASIRVTPDTAHHAVARLRRAFPDPSKPGSSYVPKISIDEDYADHGMTASVFLNLEFKGKGETPVREAIEPFVRGYRRLSLPDDAIADVDSDEEDDEFALDPSKPLVLLLGNIGHEGVLSSLSAARRQYKRKMLDSSPANWESIIQYFSTFSVTSVLIKLTPQTFRLLSLEEYESVRTKLFPLVAAVPNAVFVYEDILTGKQQQDDWQEQNYPYPSSDVLDSVFTWFTSIGIELTPYKKNAEVTVLSESFLLDTETNLIFRLYIPNGRIWSSEADRFLQLFRDYLGRVVHLTTRLDQRRTDQGVIYEFHGDESQGEVGLHKEFEEFSRFMDLCASDPNAAEALLTIKEINHKDIIDIIARYSKEAKRLQIDLKHERERKFLAIRQRLESELVDSVPTLTDWKAIDSFINAAIPSTGEISSFISLNQITAIRSGVTANSNLTVNLRPQIIQSVNGVVAQEIYGNQFLTQEDQQIISLIKTHGGAKTRELESAVHELADDSAPKTDRLGAKQKLKKFLIEVGKRTADVATGVLQTYIEKKLGL